MIKGESFLRKSFFSQLDFYSCMWWRNKTGSFIPRHIILFVSWSIKILCTLL